MIDMFTILLVFLLKSYSAEGQIMSVAPDLRLPESIAQKAPQTTSIIAITNDFILLDGKQVTTVSQVISNNKLLIPELLTELKKLRLLSEKVGEIHSNMGFTGTISLQGDRELPYLVIKKIMFTCGQIGYNDMLLTVIKPD
jgi:biopolymer transport protein ExbD